MKSSHFFLFGECEFCLYSFVSEQLQSENTEYKFQKQSVYKL